MAYLLGFIGWLALVIFGERNGIECDAVDFCLSFVIIVGFCVSGYLAHVK